MNNLILAINPGSTSTKIAVFERTKMIFNRSINHAIEELEKYNTVKEKLDYRKLIILKELELANITLESIAILVGRGGLIQPVESGVYFVNEKMKEELFHCSREHASNLGALIADEISAMIDGAKAYIADPIVVDEFEELARISGHPLFPRKSIFHALNQKSVARLHAQTTSKKYEDLNLIIAHLGGGITVGIHRKGNVIDSNQGLDGDGPFTPERSGTLPAGDLVEACFSGNYTKTEINKMIKGNGGYMAYFGTNNAYDIEQRVIEGDEKAILYHSAMAYQIAKEIGSMATVVDGEIDGIILTGGIAHGKLMVEKIRKRTKFISTLFVYPGEDELRSLAMNGFMLLTGQIQASEY